MSMISYRSEIDGLRAVAIIPVLLFHLNLEFMSGGYLGVDVFFVISGYLITRIILKEIESNRFTLKRFWARRLRRIFPVLSTMLMITSIVAYFISFRPELSSYGEVGLASVFSVANIVLAFMVGDYWGVGATNSPYLHTWSLSVEEQFYFFYPVLIFFLVKNFFENTGKVLIVFSVFSLFLFLFFLDRNPTLAFYSLPTRSWELFFGGILAFFHFNKKYASSSFSLDFFSIAGLFLIVFSMFFASEENGLGWFYVVPVLGAGLILINSNSESLVNRFLSLRCVVYVGKLSYSLYIWHWPVIVLGKYYLIDSQGDFSIWRSLILIVILSAFSYHVVEKYTREMKNIALYLIATFLLSVLPLLFLMFGSYSLTYDSSQFDMVEYYGQQYDLSPLQPESNKKSSLKRDGVKAPERDEASIKGLYASGGIIKEYGEGKPDIMVLGDSHSLMWSKVLDEIASELHVSIAFNGMTGTSPFFDIPLDKYPAASNRYTSSEKYSFNLSRYGAISDWQPKLIILISRWRSEDVYESDDLITYILENGSNILLFEQPPVLNFDNLNTSQFFTFSGFSSKKDAKQFFPISEEKRYRSGINFVSGLIEKYPDIEIFPINNVMLNDKKSWIIDGRKILYFDDDHLSYQGTKIFKDVLKNTIKKKILIDKK